MEATGTYYRGDKHTTSTFKWYCPPPTVIFNASWSHNRSVCASVRLEETLGREKKKWVDLKSHFHQALWPTHSRREYVNHSDYMDLFHTHACVKAETTHKDVHIQRNTHWWKHLIMLLCCTRHTFSQRGIFFTPILAKSCNGTFICERIKWHSDGLEFLSFHQNTDLQIDLQREEQSGTSLM